MTCRTVLRYDPVNRLMVSGADSRLEEACVEDRGVAFTTTDAKVTESGKPLIETRVYGNTFGSRQQKLREYLIGPYYPLGPRGCVTLKYLFVSFVGKELDRVFEDRVTGRKRAAALGMRRSKKLQKLRISQERSEIKSQNIRRECVKVGIWILVLEQHPLLVLIEWLEVNDDRISFKEVSDECCLRRLPFTRTARDQSALRTSSPNRS